MDKLKLAHDYAMKHIQEGWDINYDVLVDSAWQYADAMQAEAEKRKKAEAAQKRKEIREMLNAPNTFVEREGHHFDDVEEWQPDWSQAPEWAKWWAMDGFGDKKAHWYRDKPYLDDDSLIEDEWNTDLDSQKDSFAKAPSFNYQGNWKDSLRERPEPKCEVDWSQAPKGQPVTGWYIFKGFAHWISDDFPCSPAPSFGFTGTHIVERPHGF